MYRVVIVDDEEPVLDSFSFILGKESEDFSLCGKARSGTEALKLIRELKPDLVFMDIQMPGIDGIEVISQIRIHNPETVFILATAYERFDIAQKAIPLGVFSYLVKPISRKTLTNELHRVKIHLDRTRQGTGLQLEEMRFLQKTKDDVKNRLLSRLVLGSPSPEDWRTFARLYSLPGESGTVYLAEAQGELSQEARETVLGRLMEKIQYKFNCLHAAAAGRLLLFFPEDQDLERADAYLQTAAREFLPTVIVIGKGETCHYSELASSYAEAESCFDVPGTEKKSWLAEKDAMQQICTAFMKSDFPRGLSLFESFWVKIFREDPFDVAKGKMVALFTLLFNGIDFQILSAGHIDINPAEAVMAIKSVDEWRQWSSDILDRLRNLLGRHEVRSLPQHLAKALSIIHRQYNQPIQLSTIAEECQITASYLCRLFNEHLGTSFIEYLNRYRIEQAMILLRDNYLSIKETSSLVGYQDPNYFSRIFRRYMGLSPSDLVNRRSRNDN